MTHNLLVLFDFLRITATHICHIKWLNFVVGLGPFENRSSHIVQDIHFSRRPTTIRYWSQQISCSDWWFLRSMGHVWHCNQSGQFQADVGQVRRHVSFQFFSFSMLCLHGALACSNLTFSFRPIEDHLSLKSSFFWALSISVQLLAPTANAT